MELQQITKEAAQAAQLLLETAKPKPGALCVIGCSTSEVGGQMIGSASSTEIAAALWEGLYPVFEAAGVYVAVQGCEHINRALCVSRDCMEAFRLRQVSVVPWIRAGGAFVTHAYGQIPDPVMVEDLGGQATLGMDIGGTLIGMHLAAVAVPIHLEHRSIGCAHLTMARVRPKYIGGPRAKYEA